MADEDPATPEPPAGCDRPSDGTPQRYDGPAFNEIPEPDRTVDNSTIWEPDFGREYFEELYFGTGEGVESLKTYYETQSSGRYSVEGTVTDWVRVPYNEARYGRSDGFPCPDAVCTNTWDLVRDGLDQWFADQEAAGRSAEEIAIGGLPGSPRGTRTVRWLSRPRSVRPASGPGGSSGRRWPRRG